MSDYLIAKYHGIEYPLYRVNKEGIIYNVRTNNTLTPTADSTCKYPRVSLRDENGKYKKVLMHRIVAELFVPLDLPKNSIITIDDWAVTPNSVKCFIMKNMLVNHIDHNKMNYHYSNLEWVTQEENAAARNIFYNTKEQESNYFAA